MIGSEPGFSTCLAHALGFEPAQLPTADGDDPNVFWRQWLAGRNLGKWTKYSGLDPELNAGAQSNFSAADFLTAPQVRYFTARIALSF